MRYYTRQIRCNTGHNYNSYETKPITIADFEKYQQMTTKHVVKYIVKKKLSHLQHRIHGIYNIYFHRYIINNSDGK